MKDDLEKIRRAFGPRLVGKKSMQRIVCEVVAIFPPKLISEITRNCWFVSSFDDAYGFVLRGDELDRRHLIFLSDDLFDQPKWQQYYTIAHEIGHVILGHQNAILESQSKRETEKQEREADRFAKQYLEAL
jgi:hypothetical protein